MSFTWTSIVVAGVAVAFPALAQGQRRHEIGAQAIVTTADPTAVVGGLYGGVWTGRRLRLAATAGVGGQGGELAWRIEGLGHFHFNPGTTGIGVYGGAGLALAGGVETAGYIVVLVGIEGNTAGTHGWAAELGVGGGVRLGLSYRWRRGRPATTPG